MKSSKCLRDVEKAVREIWDYFVTLVSVRDKPYMVVMPACL